MADNLVCEFTIVAFPLMNPNDLITLLKIMGELDNNHLTDISTYIIVYGHIKSSIDCCFHYLGLSNFEFAIANKKKTKNLNTYLREDLNIKDYEDGEILMKS